VPPKTLFGPHACYILAPALGRSTCVIDGVDVDGLVQQQMDAVEPAVHRCLVKRRLPGVVSRLHALQPTISSQFS